MASTSGTVLKLFLLFVVVVIFPFLVEFFFSVHVFLLTTEGELFFLGPEFALTNAVLVVVVIDVCNLFLLLLCVG